MQADLVLAALELTTGCSRCVTGTVFRLGTLLQTKLLATGCNAGQAAGAVCLAGVLAASVTEAVVAALFEDEAEVTTFATHIVGGVVLCAALRAELGGTSVTQGANAALAEGWPIAVGILCTFLHTSGSGSANAIFGALVAINAANIFAANVATRLACTRAVALAHAEFACSFGGTFIVFGTLSSVGAAAETNAACRSF